MSWLTFTRDESNLPLASRHTAGPLSDAEAISGGPPDCYGDPIAYVQRPV